MLELRRKSRTGAGFILGWRGESWYIDVSSNCTRLCFPADEPDDSFQGRNAIIQIAGWCTPCLAVLPGKYI